MALAVAGMSVKALLDRSAIERDQQPSDRIPFYTSAPPQLANAGMALIKRYDCRDCHSLWAMRDPLQAVPAPALDGIGALRDEAWLYNYLSAEDPQQILPTRLKPQYRMPSFAHLPESERRTLAAYLASLKVEDWYLDETKAAEYEKLTGQEYRP